MGCCIIKAFNAPALSNALSLPENFKPRYVLALGYPDQKIEIETMQEGGDADFKYYRTKDGVHHVPKRSVNELIIPTSGK